MANISFVGGRDAGIVGGDGVSLTSVSFAEGGHISNINAHIASRNVAISVGATSSSNNAFGVSGGSAVGAGTGTGTTGPALPAGSIKIPLSAYVGESTS
ncbi:hypothetical protein, partial [Campylobacter concisus]